MSDKIWYISNDEVFSGIVSAKNNRYNVIVPSDSGYPLIIDKSSCFASCVDAITALVKQLGVKQNDVSNKFANALSRLSKTVVETNET